MIETAPLHPTMLPLAFFVWAPVLVMVLFWLVGVWASRQGVARVLENDWNGFDAADVTKLFAAYGPERLSRYRRRILPADMALGVFYAAVGAAIAIGLVSRGQPLWVAALCGGGWLLGGLCDIAENAFIARLIDRYPAVNPRDVALASGFTRLKLVLFSLGVIGALAAVWLVFRPLTG